MLLINFMQKRIAQLLEKASLQAVGFGTDKSSDMVPSETPDLIKWRSVLLRRILLFVIPFVFYLIVANMMIGDAVFIMQNSFLDLVFLTSYILLLRGNYDAAVFLIFGTGLPVAQISFLAGEFLSPADETVRLISFAIVNACLSVLVAAVFIRKKAQHLLVIVLISAIIGIHVYLHFAAEGGSNTNLAGMAVYYAIAVGFAMLTRNVLRKIEELVMERELLIREVHHRIKNHMYTITSILSLQSTEFEDPKVKEAFEETRRRIGLMQEIYDRLYLGQPGGEINLRSFLEKLLLNLQEVFCSGKNLLITSEIEELQGSSKITFAVGIIVNELVTNSFKYAFGEKNPPVTGKERMEIRVNVHKNSDGKIEIIVSDNGIGVSDEILDGSAYGFGLTMVQGYVRQFDGSLSIENTGGTKISVTLLPFS